MPREMKELARGSSDSEPEEDEEAIRKRLKLLSESRQLGRHKRKFVGGFVVSSEKDANNMSTSASLSASEKKGLKEVEELERELDLKNTFSKETNRRDQDAEMNKYIDEQIRLRREAARRDRQDPDETKKRKSREDEDDLSEIFTLPAGATDRIDDILLHSLSKHIASRSDEKSEAMLSSQMLNGIPEVDLGINERIRTIEATEEAKLQMAAGSNRNKSRVLPTVPVNYSTNFQQHRANRDIHDGELRTSRSERPKAHSSDAKIVTEPVVVVGAEPDKVECRLPSTGQRPPPKGKASDDYYLSKFKRTNRK